MSNVYTQRSSAVRAAKNACGPNQEWVIKQVGDGFTFVLLDENEVQHEPDVQPAQETAVEAPKTAPDAPKVNKMAVATEIFKRMTAEGKARKEIILAFVVEAGLTKAGSATYYQTIKTKN